MPKKEKQKKKVPRLFLQFGSGTVETRMSKIIIKELIQKICGKQNRQTATVEPDLNREKPKPKVANKCQIIRQRRANQEKVQSFEF